MRWNEILEYTTKSGEDIDFKYKEDSEGDNNRGWIVNQIDAYVNGKYAGYIAISYIPKDRFVKHYPTILNYMSNFGKLILPSGKHDVHYKNLNDNELKQTIKNLSYYSRKYNDLWYGRKEVPEDRKELLSIIEDIIKNELKDEKKKFKKFSEYHIDKPIVDYIRVFKQDEDRNNRRNKDNKIHNSEENFQRQYIGTALYFEAAEWLKKKGLKLYASGLQQPEAEAAWSKFEKEGRVSIDGKRRYLDI